MTTTRHAIDGKCIIQLPTKDGITNIGESRELAEKRFYKLEKRFKLNENLRLDYAKFLEEYEQLGHMSRIVKSWVITD